MQLLSPNDPNPAALAGLPENLHQMLAYWQGKCAGRAMPARADINPAEIKTLLPDLILVDVVYKADAKPDFVYRLVGTRETEIRGANPTGRRVAEAFHGPSADNVLGCYLKVVAGKAPLLDDEYFFREDDNYADEANLFLPLSNDGQNVNMILVFTAYRRL